MYGNNSGLINDTIENDLKPLYPKKVYSYDEGEILNNQENFKQEILNKSFFDNEKLIIISRVTDKILTLIEEIIEKDIEDITFIIKSGQLDKKSKIRNFFEKNSKTVCIAFYEDTNQTLNQLAKKFLMEKI